MAAALQGGAGHSLGGPLLISSTSSVQRTVAEEDVFSPTNWFTFSLTWSVLSLSFQRECFILYEVLYLFPFVSMWINFSRQLTTVGLVHEHTIKYTWSVFFEGIGCNKVRCLFMMEQNFERRFFFFFLQWIRMIYRSYFCSRKWNRVWLNHFRQDLSFYINM